VGVRIRVRVRVTRSAISPVYLEPISVHLPASQVLMAMDIITKEKKNIMWRGLPTNTEQEGRGLGLGLANRSPNPYPNPNP